MGVGGGVIVLVIVSLKDILSVGFVESVAVSSCVTVLWWVSVMVISSVSDDVISRELDSDSEGSTDLVADMVRLLVTLMLSVAVSERSMDSLALANEDLDSV